MCIYIYIYTYASRDEPRHVGAKRADDRPTQSPRTSEKRDATRCYYYLYYD